jgi:hypothetical protein
MFGGGPGVVKETIAPGRAMMFDCTAGDVRPGEE